MTWRIFLRGHRSDTGARLLLRAGGKTPGETRNRLEASLVSGKLDDEAYRVRADALEEWRDKYDHRHEEPADDLRRDWVPMPTGGSVRASFITSDEYEVVRRSVMDEEID